MTAFWPSLDDQLADLNERASTELDQGNRYPAPDGLPPVGSWIRAMKVDDDSRGTPAGPWHTVAGWDGRWGRLSTRCRGKPGKPISYGLDRLLGGRATMARWPSWKRYALLVQPERPDEGACQQCDARLERDAAAVVKAREDAERAALVELLPAIGAIATDDSIDDADRGRRLRELWPS